MKRHPVSTTRRQFIGRTAAAIGFPAIVPASVFGQNAPSNRITMGVVGWGMMGPGNTSKFLAESDCQVVAACDIDKQHLAAATSTINGYYKNTDCKTYHDYRELMARKDIDTVMLALPDNWHGVVSVEAAKQGKDIYGEKPLARTITEQQAIVAAVQKYQRIWQTGSWQRSEDNFRIGAEIVRNGLLGKLTRVEVGLPAGHNDFAKTGDKTQITEPPAHLDYEMWIGPSAMEPYIEARIHKNWRWNYNTGGGQLMDWIGHHCDIAHWGLANPKFGCGPDDALGPLELSATAEFPAQSAIWNTATKFRIDAKYPSDVEMVIAGGYNEIAGGAKWIGPNGWVSVNRDKFTASDTQWIRDIQVLDKKGDLEIPLYRSPGHFREFLDCIKSRKRTLTPVEIAHCSQVPGHLGRIAAITGRKLTWNTGKQEIVGDAEAQAMTQPKMRGPWTL